MSIFRRLVLLPALFRRLVLLPAFLALVLPMWGQTTAQISGTVTDNTGAVIVGAGVTATNTETGVERKTTTNSEGLYTLPFLPPGNYQVAVTQTGFKQLTRQNVRLEVNQTARLDFAMEIGDVTETIQVTASAPLIDSDTSAIGQVIETKAIEDLPLNGRNFVQLAILAPGVTGVGFGARGTIMSGNRPDDLRPGSEIFSNGNREGSNNFLMDGVDNNERLTLAIVLRPSVEAVREFKMQTNLFAAEQGRNPGATVNIITKSGSNEWHGSAYEFLRNDIFDARNYFAKSTDPKPVLRQNQFGGSFGGKIIPNRLFFFTNYEGYRRIQQSTQVNTVPTEAMRRGDFSAVRNIFDPLTTRPDLSAPSEVVRSPFPNRMIPQNRFDPVMARVIQAYPLPTSPGLVNNHVSFPRETQRWDQGDLRIDWNASSNDTVFGRFSRQDTVTTKPATFPDAQIPGAPFQVGLGNENTFAGDSALIAHNIAAGWTKIWTPTLVMEARMGFNRFDLNFTQEGSIEGAKLGEALGVPNANQGPAADGVPIFSPAGYTGIGQTRSLPIIREEDTYHPSVNTTWLKGRHTVKFGIDLRARNLTIFQTNRGNGRFNFSRTFTNDPNNAGSTGDSIASLLLGTASVIQQDFTLFFPDIRTDEWGTYVQDDWKVTDRLTLNIGLRYEYFTRPYEKNDRWTNFDVTTGKLLIAGFNTDRYTGLEPDANNFAPRFGFAFNMRQGTVLRGGYGIYYNTPGSESVYMRRHRQLPFGPINTIDVNQFDANPRRVSQGLPPIPNLDFETVANNPVGSMLALPANFVAPYVQQFNLQIQQALPFSIVTKIGYVGNLGRKLDSTYDFNQPVPGPGAPGPRRPLFGIAPGVVGVNYNVTDGKSAYHALQASLEKRFSAGIGFLTSYTWGHAIDDVANQFGGADNGPIPQDRRFRQLDRGDSGFDIRHRFVHSTNWELPFGKGRRYSSGNDVVDVVLGNWQMNAIITAQTGLPFTPVLATSVSNAGGSRPDRLKSGDLENPDPAKWFDTSFSSPGAPNANAAWAQPEQFTFGNAGRNILRGPGRVNVDYSLFKEFPITEKFNLEFRAEVFNLFNTPQFDLPNASIGNPNAGTITGIVGNPRQLQFGLRLEF